MLDLLGWEEALMMSRTNFRSAAELTFGMTIASRWVPASYGG